MTTLESLTTAQISALLSEAAQAGDDGMVSDCKLALSGHAMTVRAAARQRIVDAINYAEAQDDEPSAADRDAANTFARLTVELLDD